LFNGTTRANSIRLKNFAVSCGVVLGFLAASGAVWAQLAPPNEQGVTMGHWHAIVRDVDAAKKFWALFGATPLTIDGTAVMKLPGVFIFLNQGAPTGSTMVTSLNHVGLRVSNGKQLRDALKMAGRQVRPR
jgi:hypothetical protein